MTESNLELPEATAADSASGPATPGAAHDIRVPIQTVEPAGPTPNFAPTQGVDIEIDAIDTFFYAVSNRAVVRRITIRNVSLPEDGDEIVVTASVESPSPVALLHPYAVAIPSFPIRDEKTIANVRLESNHRALVTLDEQVNGQIVVTARQGGRVVGTARSGILFLAFNQWMFKSHYYDSLAAFVQPNNEAIRPILSRAGELLGERTGSDATQGYQALRGDPGRIRETARAVYDALCEENLRYTDPPASFEGYGQKVRTPEIVLLERAATCLDSSILYASCLLALGLDAHIVLLHDHAFVTYDPGIGSGEVDPETLVRILRRSVVDNPNDVALLFQEGLLRPVETTLFTSDRDDSSFEEAERQDVAVLTSGIEKIAGLINIAYARAHGVPAIPSQRILAAAADPSAEVDLVPHAWLPEGAEAHMIGASHDEAASTEDGADVVRAEMRPAPARVTAWLRSLLDLTFSNPLLRLGGASGTTGAYRVDLPAGLLGALEDRLMAHGTIDLLSAAQAPLGLVSDPTKEAFASELANTGRLYTPDFAALDGLRASAKRRIVEAHPDLAPAELDSVADSAAADWIAANLDRSLNGIRRKAREIETQTGANTLFLTIGTLVWKEQASARGRTNENQGRAPLFLIPVRITGKAKTGFRVTAGDAGDVIPNYCLLEKLRQTHGLVIEDLERPIADDAGIDVDRLISKVRQALSKANIRDAVVNEDAYLAVLNFSTFRLWKDMRDHWETFLESPVVRHLVEHPNESFDNLEPDSLIAAADLRCPIECDQSQLEAVRWSVEGRSFVLEGPPGTGKSQTIANLLAANIAAGKKVLFVAEKQAALEVVKKRLDKVGLGPFCLDLHDKGSKPDQIRSQIRNSLDFEPVDRTSEWNDVNARWSADAAVLADYRDAIHTESASGHSAWSARQESMTVGAGPSFPVPAAFIESATTQVPLVRAALLDLPRVLGPGSVAPNAPWVLSGRRSFESVDLAALVSAIDALATVRATLDAAPGGATTALGGVDEPLGLPALVRTLDLWHGGQLPSDTELAQLADPAWIQARDAALDRLDAVVAQQAPVLAMFSPSIYATDVTPMLAAGLEAASAGVFGRGKKVKAFLATLQPVLLAPTETPADQLVALLQHVAATQPELRAAQDAVAALPGARLPAGWTPFVATDRSGVRTQLKALAAEAQLLQSPASVSTRRALVSGWAPDQAMVELLRSAAGWWQYLLQMLEATPDSLERWRNGRTFIEAWAESEPGWRSDAPRFLGLQRWTQLVDTLAPVRAAGLDDIADAVVSGSVPASEAYDRFHRGFIATALLERLEAGRIDLFDGRAHDRRIEDFDERDRQRRAIIRDLIPAELVNARPIRGGRRVGKWGALEQELNRKSRRLSIRKLIGEYCDILPDLTPCFLMSPDSVARFIPPGSITFDLVVFDEASQIEVAESIGAIGRARSVVIVGDTRQMPPSRFGGGVSSDPDGDLELDSDDETLFEDLESILSECVESNLPRLYLECHYRSRHEALIAFSNHNFYENRLTTFPSPAGPDVMPIGWRRVDGVFNRGGKGEDNRTNRDEAEAIVADIRARLADPARSHQSIAVVTLNAPQQLLITRLLEESEDETIKALLDDEGEDGLIVRNLESVQGDERDVIMLSIAFSPPITQAEDGSTQRGRLPLNFGPLNKQGGERRLNVAVTRARAEVVVFCSFDPEEMKVSDGSSLGLRLLRIYLENARDGIKRSADLVGRAPTAPDLHRSEIAEALRSRGLKVRENVGLSTFRIDLAVGRPEDDDWAVAILLDGPGWASRATVFDRDALPPSVLHHAMGWRRIERLWFPMWLYARDEVLDDIERAVAEACAEPAPTPVPSEIVAFDAPTEVPGPGEPADGPDTIVEAIVADSSGIGLTDLGQGTGLGSTQLEDQATPVAAAAPSIARASGSDLTSTTLGAPDPGATVAPPADRRAARTALGERDVLDQLAEPRCRSLVVQAIAEALDDEAPISAAQLARNVAARFGLERVRQNRADSILDLVPPHLRRSGELGDFVWSEQVDPETWSGYRDADAYGADRPPDLIAPEEIGNAMVDLVRQGVEVSSEELLRHTADVFGTKRLTAGVRTRLDAVIAWTVDTGRLVRVGDSLRLPNG